MALHPTICKELFQRDRYHFSISPKALRASYLKHPGMPNREIPLLQAECTPITREAKKKPAIRGSVEESLCQEGHWTEQFPRPPRSLRHHGSETPLNLISCFIWHVPFRNNQTNLKKEISVPSSISFKLFKCQVPAQCSASPGGWIPKP